jgi:hypothetical protein
MFSPEVVCDDKFIDMPSSTQALYFQLGMHADDDGFVGPKKVMRIMGASEDDLKILIAKKFVIPFESGVLVIKHWKVNNLIRKDWYRPTTHTEERALISSDKSGCYQFVNETVPSSSTQVGSKAGSNRDLSKDEMQSRLDAGKAILRGKRAA